MYLFKRSTATLVAVSMLFSACSPAIVAPDVGVDQVPMKSQTLIEVLDRHGRVKFSTNSPGWAYQEWQPSESTARPIDPRRNLREMRDALQRLPNTSPEQRRKNALYLSMLEALASTTNQDLHNRVSALPVERRQTDLPKAHDGTRRQLIEFLVNGRVQIRVTRQPVDRASDRSVSAQVVSAAMASAYGEDHLPCYEDCGEGGEPYTEEMISQEDRDDGLAMAAVVNAEYEATSAAIESDIDDFESWWISTHSDVNSPDRVPLGLAAGTFESLQYTSSMTSQLWENPCGNEIQGVVGRGLTTLASIFGVIGIASSPEPFSKALFHIAVGNMLGQMVSLDAAIGSYTSCKSSYS